jgi:signal transduction histidine kinase
VTVVENHSEREMKRARWIFPAYLVTINLFVVPIAAAGLMILPRGFVEPDMYVLALPMAKGADALSTLVFIGGLSAATAMVVVESVALSIMVCNGLVVPLLLHRRLLDVDKREDLAGLLLIIRRFAIVAVVLGGYVVYHALGESQGLAAIGLVSFAAIAQLAPAFFGGLLWRRGTARGAIAGILAGFAIWAYTLLLPWIVKAGLISADITNFGPFGLTVLRPQALFYLSFDPLTHGVLWSILANIAAYVMVSLWRAPEPIERLQAHIFVHDDLPRAPPAPAFRLWRTSLTVADLQATVTRYLGTERAERSFAEHAASRGVALDPQSEADVQVIRFTEHLLTSAIGAASARLVMSLLLRRGNVHSPSALKLLDDASEALQYNRDLLQSALDQVRHGLGVFDKDMHLVCWNRQFRELLDLPAELGRVGIPLKQILHLCADRGDFGPGSADEHVADRLMRYAVVQETFMENLDGGRRILEIRISPMPQPIGGIVCTFSDITDSVAAAEALARANETLERRVLERTTELESANAALGAAKAKADDANRDKTRFLAAASHDLMQPLNAARLYASSLIERRLGDNERTMAHNIDASLTAVEDILSALMEISRIDAGRLEPEIAPTSLAEMLTTLEVEFAPLARETGLELRFAGTEHWVSTDRRLLRRVLQNLIGNALKYTPSGTVEVATEVRHDRIRIQVRDTGPGIPASKHEIIFKEFQRLDSTAREARGLGLGLSIVDRIARLLDVPLGLSSSLGKGSTFWIDLPLAPPGTREVTNYSSAAGHGIGQMHGCLVLCVENEPAVQSGMHALLTGWGCEVLMAASTAEAVAAISDPRRLPCVILADYHLDESDTGIAAITAVRRKIGNDIPAVVITADTSAEVGQLLRDGDVLVLRKPLKAASLRSIVARYAVTRRTAAE